MNTLDITVKGLHVQVQTFFLTGLTNSLAISLSVEVILWLTIHFGHLEFPQPSLFLLLDYFPIIMRTTLHATLKLVSDMQLKRHVDSCTLVNQKTVKIYYVHQPM